GLVEQDVALAVVGGEDQALEQVAQRHTALAGVGVLLGVGVVLARRVPRGAAHDGVVGDQFAVVDAGLLDRDLALAVVGHVADGEDRVAALGGAFLQGGVHPVGRGAHETVAVGVHHVPVDPRLLVGGQPV